MRVVCHLIRENRQPCQPVGDRRVATARLAEKKADGRSSQAVTLRVSVTGGCRASTGCMSAMREELHLVELLPEAGLRPAPRLIRADAAGITARKQTCPYKLTVHCAPGVA